ncbi:MAG: formate acetyltransferase, partial [Syntrophomonadaceae bacterium]|nr:formate acetyltransferase [Syntrophomonadaceae bacterium]
MHAWRNFNPGLWTHEINVRDFIQKNYTPYEGDSRFLNPPTENTEKLWSQCQELLKQERLKGGVLEVDADNPISITSHPPGYINRELEQVVGLQTDEPLKRAINIYGGLRHAANACRAYGYELNPDLKRFFQKHRRTHNDGVFAVYTPEMRLARKVGIITGLPDSYGRGRIIGDYRRVPLYGADFLIKAKQQDLSLLSRDMTDANIQLREELFD